MRISELLRSVAVSPSGSRLGRIHDVRLRHESSAKGSTFYVTKLVISNESVLSRVAHAWGFAQRRAQGPWPLRSLTSHAVRSARVIPAELVTDWGPGKVMIRAELAELRPLVSDDE